MKKFLCFALGIFLVTIDSYESQANTNLALKSARQTSTYYAFSVGVSNAIMAGASDIVVTVETSPGSMVNVKESKTRNNFLFTAPPILIRSAIAAKGKFEEGGYENIRSLLPLPGLVMHWVVTEQSGVKSLQEMAGKKFVPGGAGSAGAKFTKEVFGIVGVEEKVKFLTVDLNEGVQAVRNRRAVGFSTASSPPAAMVTEISATMPIRLLSLPDEYFNKLSHKFSRYTIPAGTYSGVDSDTNTISLLVGMYTKADLPEQTAYKITKAFWENRSTWEKVHPAMKLLKMSDVNSLVAGLHPGAKRYYEEIDFKLNVK